MFTVTDSCRCDAHGRHTRLFDNIVVEPRWIDPIGPTWEGPVLVSQATIPAGIEYKVIGSVQADARVGYDSATSLYPLLAAEAKKIGANAVINAKGGRRVTAFSWSAAYVSGIAVKIEDPPNPLVPVGREGGAR